MRRSSTSRFVLAQWAFGLCAVALVACLNPIPDDFPNADRRPVVVGVESDEGTALPPGSTDESGGATTSNGPDAPQNSGSGASPDSSSPPPAEEGAASDPDATPPFAPDAGVPADAGSGASSARD